MYTFSKSERLCSQTLIDRLFQEGEHLMVFPFNVRYLVCSQEVIPTRAQVLIVAPKRRLHHAIDRNHAKRLMREVYRLHKPQLYQLLESRQQHLLLSISYTHPEIFPFDVMEKKYLKLLSQLEKSLAPQDNEISQ
ncbi:MAG: ribonuclease P protein component [Bacteroidales bacterium]|nr:ribonuclease P protein component [Bacteroidales bacterium]